MASVNFSAMMVAAVVTVCGCSSATDDAAQEWLAEEDPRWPSAYSAPLESTRLMGVEFRGEYFVCCGDSGDGQVRAAIFSPDTGWRLLLPIPDSGGLEGLSASRDEVTIVFERQVLYYRPDFDDVWRAVERPG